MAASKAPDFIRVQNDIRRNASRLQDSLRDLAEWETNVKKKDLAIRKKTKSKKSIPAVRGYGKKVYSGSTGGGGALKPHPWIKNSVTSSGDSKEKTKVPSAHVYDKGYKKWEKFDVESALKEVDDESKVINSNDGKNVDDSRSSLPEETHATKYKSPAAAHRARKAKMAADKLAASKISKDIAKTSETVRQRQAKQPQLSREEIERLDGNKLYKKGDFNGAIKCYTRCIGLNPENYIAYSNRAMAYLKAKNFACAEEDCSSALRLNAKHVKSWNRRGTARNKLGRHRAALRDFEAVLLLEPRNKQAINEIRKTREAIKISVKKAPKKTATLTESGGKSIPWVTCSPSAESSSKNDGQKDPSSKDAANEDATVEVTNAGGSGSRTVPRDSSESGHVVDKAQAVVRERAREIAMSNDSLSPASMFSFMNIWKSLKGDDEGKSLYLSSIDKGALKRLFKGEVEADVFIEILNLCNSFLPTSGKRTLEIVYALSNCSNFDMNILFCNEADKVAIKDCVGRIAAMKDDQNIKASVQKLILKIEKSGFGKI